MENSRGPLSAFSHSPSPGVVTSAYAALHFDAPPRVELPPSLLTGCLSNLAGCSCEEHEHAYFEALRDYAEVYAATQAYLGPDDPLSGHDYAAVVAETEEHSRLGLLGDESVPKPEEFSDEDVDRYGYFGWLHH
jgi:hypothetical protein